jgi:hypothetical protein
MVFHEQLNDSLTKERGGRQGGKGHEFQRYWTLCYVLELDLEQDDYLVLLEFIEDVAVLDSENAPSSMDLFQVKKKEGITAKWSQAALTRPVKGGKSILAKLIESRSIATGGTRSVTFVSNAPVQLKLSTLEDSTVRISFRASELEEGLKICLRASVANELCCDVEKIDLGDLKFVRSALAMDDLENHAFGKVAAYLAKKFPDHTARADVLCRVLYSEIKVKATATGDAGTFDDLKKIRGISKSQLSEMLSLTISRKPDREVVGDVISDLCQEKVPFSQRKAIKEAAC